MRRCAAYVRGRERRKKREQNTFVLVHIYIYLNSRCTRAIVRSPPERLYITTNVIGGLVSSSVTYSSSQARVCVLPSILAICTVDYGGAVNGKQPAAKKYPVLQTWRVPSKYTVRSNASFETSCCFLPLPIGCVQSGKITRTVPPLPFEFFMTSVYWLRVPFSQNFVISEKC